MKIAPVAKSKFKFSAYLKASEELPDVVTRNWKAVAVLISVTDDEELEWLLLAHSRRFQALIASARAQIDDGQGIPHDESWREGEGPAS